MHILSKVLCDFEHYFAICFFIYLLYKPEYWNTSAPFKKNNYWKRDL